jgi:hypothetical protein
MSTHERFIYRLAGLTALILASCSDKSHGMGGRCKACLLSKFIEEQMVS